MLEVELWLNPGRLGSQTTALTIRPQIGWVIKRWGVEDFSSVNFDIWWKKACGLRTNIAALNVLSLCWPKEWLYLLERIAPSFKGGCFFNFIWGPLSIVATFCIPPPHSTLLFESNYKSCFELPEEQCPTGLSNRLQVKSCKDQLQLFPYDYFWGGG